MDLCPSYLLAFFYKEYLFRAQKGRIKAARNAYTCRIIIELLLLRVSYVFTLLFLILKPMTFLLDIIKVLKADILHY